MNDKVFGEVEYQDGAWTQTVDISLFGREKEMDIIIQDDEKEGILDIQRNAYVTYSKNLSIYKETVPQTLLCYFLDHFEEIDKVVELSEDAQKDTIKAERIFRMFMIMSLYFDRKGNFGWICRFSWEDNGLAILLSEDKPRIITPNQLRNYRKIDDPIFGEMIYNEVWEKSEKKLLYGKEKLVTIAACDYADGITDVHRACYKKYQENEAKYLEEIPRVLLEYYLVNFDEIKEYWRVPRAYAKKNITQENIMELIDFDCLYFMYDGTFAWLCECAWDEEDAGLAFVMGDGKVRVELQTDVL